MLFTSLAISDIVVGVVSIPAWCQSKRVGNREAGHTASLNSSIF